MRNPILFLFIMAFFAGIGCNPDDELLLKRFQNGENDSNPIAELIADDSGSKELDLFGGEEICGLIIKKPMLTNGNFVGGTLYIANSEDEILIKIIPVEGWLISEINLYFGDLAEMPASQSGNPLFSEFIDTYINPPLPEVSIPIDLLNSIIGDDGNITVVAHAKIAKITDGDELDPAVKSIIAQWDVDFLFLGPRGGGGFLYDMQSCDVDPDGTSVDDDPLAGMVDELPVEPYCVDPGELPLFNKKNDPDQVEPLGMVEFSTDAENMIFSFSVGDPEWKISSIHVNVGDFDADQFNGGGNVPLGRYDFNASYEIAEEATIEDPFEFFVPLIEIESDLNDEGCGEFYVQVTLYQEIFDGETLIGSNTQSVSIAWSDGLSVSGRQRGGSLVGGSQGGGSGSQGGGSGSQGGGSIDPASIPLCLYVCTTE